MDENDITKLTDSISADELNGSRKEKMASGLIFILLLILYVIGYIFTTKVARSSDFFVIGESQLPISAFAGVFSSVTNLSLIFIAFFFRKRGFITALILLISQVPILLFNLIAAKNLTSVPGLFTDIFTIIAVIIIYKRNTQIDSLQQARLDYLERQSKKSRRLFEQTATALVNSIDAKDKCSHGHSVRVAEYSSMIAQMMGKSEEECYKIYYTALLHDVGKIGIKNDILNKKGKLDPEEYETVKMHPVFGDQILSSISEYPYLSIGAHYHHERYDGKGYPDKLKGEDIPEIARIIAVADAYDAMTSKRSYRDAIPQQLVREVIVKNAGTQFDPNIAKVMQHIIDLDTEFMMKEKTDAQGLVGKNEIVCTDYRSEISEGIYVTPNVSTIRFICRPYRKGKGIPSIVLFDSLDGRIHLNEKEARDLNYFEYGEICFDGQTTCTGARKMKSVVKDHKHESDRRNTVNNSTEIFYTLEASRYKDHALIRIDDDNKITEVTVALPDSTRYCYIGLTGENCVISDVNIGKSEDPISEGYITRIAEEISFIDGPEGDIPNVQVDGFRSDASVGIPLTGEEMTISFHTKSLPTARLIWHCPFLDIFHAADGKVNGADYRDYALIRIDGENWKGEGKAENELIVEKTDNFVSWDDWKKDNKKGFDCTIRLSRNDRVIVMETENNGIRIKNTTTVLDDTDDIYVALTGDQVALTNIWISRS